MRSLLKIINNLAKMAENIGYFHVIYKNDINHEQRNALCHGIPVSSMSSFFLPKLFWVFLPVLVCNSAEELLMSKSKQY